MKRLSIPPPTFSLAAVLLAVGFSMPALADPEVWLQHHGSWSKDAVSFNLTCSNEYAVSPYGHTFDYDNPIDNIPVTPTSGPTPNWIAPGGYPASTHIYVEARDIGEDFAKVAMDNEALPADHPGRAWGKTKWCELWNDCREVRTMEIDIRLTTSPSVSPAVTLVDHNSSASGESTIQVTRGAYTSFRGKIVTVSRLCTTAGQNIRVTVGGQQVGSARPLD